MIRRDYVLRLVERLAKVLLQIIGLRTKGQHKEAKVLIAESFHSLIGLNYDLIEALAVKDVIGFLQTGGEPDPVKCIAAARLFAEQAQVLEAERNLEEAQMLRVKSLEICIHVCGLLKSEDSLRQHLPIKALLEKLKEVGISQATMEKLKSFGY